MTISLSIMNQSTVISDAAVQAMIPAFSQQWNGDLTSVWSVDPCAMTFYAKGITPAPGSWWCVFLDDSDQADALAYHDLTNEGLPISKVFCKTILADRALISVGATHELCEMAVDPWLNSAYQDLQGTFWAGEVADPVEDDQYGYKIGDVLVTDFVSPDWFAHAHSVKPVDYKGHAHAPFAVLTGGYAQKFDPKSGWVQVTGAKAMASARAKNAPIGSRRDRRFRQWSDWEKSDATF